MSNAMVGFMRELVQNSIYHRHEKECHALSCYSFNLERLDALPKESLAGP